MLAWLYGEERRLLVLGLDNAGKTTVLQCFQEGESVTQTIPTVGFNVETVRFKHLTFRVWDLGGQTNIRPYWRCYYPQTSAIIFVVDSADIARFGESKQELLSLLTEPELRGVPLLVFANKQDLENAATIEEITLRFALNSIGGRKWVIRPACAKDQYGVVEGLEWLSTAS